MFSYEKRQILWKAWTPNCGRDWKKQKNEVFLEKPKEKAKPQTEENKKQQTNFGLVKHVSFGFFLFVFFVYLEIVHLKALKIQWYVGSITSLQPLVF